jgi:hypothetical protein
LGYATLLIAVATAVAPVSATSSLPDVQGYDDISTSCTGGSNYWFQHNYQSLHSLGWGDRISRFRATNNSHRARWYRDVGYDSPYYSFVAGGCDKDLTNNPVEPGSSQNWNDRFSSLEVY